jgi:hypothetical protein
MARRYRGAEKAPTPQGNCGVGKERREGVSEASASRQSRLLFITASPF